MQDLVSGGQVTMHGIRMLGQVMQKLWSAAVFGFIGISLYWFFDTSTEYDRHMLRTWLEADIRSSFYENNSPDLHRTKITYDKRHKNFQGELVKYEVETSIPEFYRYCNPYYRNYRKAHTLSTTH